jgi:hypothetical protein
VLDQGFDVVKSDLQNVNIYFDLDHVTGTDSITLATSFSSGISSFINAELSNVFDLETLMLSGDEATVNLFGYIGNGENNAVTLDFSDMRGGDLSNNFDGTVVNTWDADFSDATVNIKIGDGDLTYNAFYDYFINDNWDSNGSQIEIEKFMFTDNDLGQVVIGGFDLDDIVEPDIFDTLDFTQFQTGGSIVLNASYNEDGDIILTSSSFDGSITLVDAAVNMFDNDIELDIQQLQEINVIGAEINYNFENIDFIA